MMSPSHWHNSYTVIDTSNWKRKLHCEIFRNALQPHYNVCLELDISNFIRKVKENKWSFSLAFIHTITKCANEMEEFRYRFLNDEVVLYETIHTSFTYLDAESELFKVVNVPMVDDIEEYIETAKETIANQKGIYYRACAKRCLFSSLPWIRFTNFSHTFAGKSDMSNPMFDWRKFIEKDGKVLIPFAIQVHHSFIDDFHVGKFVEHLQNKL